MKRTVKVIDIEDTTAEGIETVRCGDTLKMLGKSFVVDGVRYFMPICPHPVDLVTKTARGEFCGLCNSQIR